MNEKKETFEEMTARVLSGMDDFQEEFGSGVEHLVWLQCQKNGALKNVCVTCGRREAERIAEKLRARLDPSEEDVIIGVSPIERIRFVDVKDSPDHKEVAIKKIYTC